MPKNDCIERIISELNASDVKLTINRTGLDASGNVASNASATFDTEDRTVGIYLPDNFREGNLFHELCHCERAFIKRVGILKSVREVNGEPRFCEDLENSLEHIVIVPREIRHFPESKEYWLSQFAGRSYTADVPWLSRLYLVLAYALLMQIDKDGAVFRELKNTCREMGYNDIRSICLKLISASSKKQYMIDVLIKNGCFPSNFPVEYAY